MPVYQNDPKAIDTLHEYGCLFCSLNFYREIIGQTNTIDDVNTFWNQSLQQGFIDSGFVIQSYSGIISIMGLPLQYIDGHFPPSTIIAPNVYSIMALHRPSNGFTHFCVGNRKENLIFDPIQPYSLTAHDPATFVDSLRLFTIIG
jgi:hypothetical protein